MRGEVHILVYCPIDTLQWGSTHSAMIGLGSNKNVLNIKCFFLVALMKNILTSRGKEGEKTHPPFDMVNKLMSCYIFDIIIPPPTPPP